MIYFRHQVRRFVIVMQGRTGSSYLVEALDSHPSVRAVGEQLVGLRAKGSDAQLQWTRRFFTPALVGTTRAVGFKTKLADVLDPDGFAELLKQTQVAVIRLQRRNLVKLVVSWVNAQRLYKAGGKWHVYDDRDRLPPPTIDVEDFARRLEWVEEEKRQMEAFVDSLNLPVLPLYYEDLLVDERTTFDRVFAFLGVRFQPVRGRTLKVTSDDLREAIANFDELCARYAGTPYKSMFDEVLAPA